ncbi:hypothetical protein [Spartinivicinus marinus]|uniref:hypothetical protein n=1 Tax=Spartinivicinus marinus TaxID=2994442 RepID=UPI001C5C9B3C
MKSIFFILLEISRSHTLTTNKPVTAVCDAPAVLLNAKDAQVNYVVKGKAVTGFSNSEKEAVTLTNVVPSCWKMSWLAAALNIRK